jgi:ribosomal protein S27E
MMDSIINQRVESGMVIRGPHGIFIADVKCPECQNQLYFDGYGNISCTKCNAIVED